MGTEVHRQLSRIGDGFDGAIDVSALRVPVCVVAAQQSRHQLHQFVSQSRGVLSADAAGAMADNFSMEIYRVHTARVMGVPVFNRAIAGGFRFDAACAVAFLPDYYRAYWIKLNFV